ncbi:MAG: hypothetical protein KTR25_06055 [Myxococcales bacterium]|nr:hypothetical protein [Myxococcales bacterium]
MGAPDGCTGPSGSKGWRSHRPLTNAGNKSERGPEVKDRPLAGHRKSELGASRVLFPWNVWTGFAFHRLHTPGKRPLHPERFTKSRAR